MSFRAKLATRYDCHRLPRWMLRLMTRTAALVDDAVIMRYYFCGIAFYTEIF